MDTHDSMEFRQPVDFKALGLHDYLDVVKKPMDLGTVQRKLNANEYRIVEECLDDIQIIWDNCKLYNGTQSVIPFNNSIVDLQIGGKIRKIIQKVCQKLSPTRQSPPSGHQRQRGHPFRCLPR